MIADFLYIIAVLLLAVAFLTWSVDKQSRSLSKWRHVLFFVALLSLAASAATMLVGRLMLENPGDVTQQITVLRRVGRPGLILTMVGLITCWFGTWKTITCLLSSGVIIALLWLAAFMAI